MTSIIQILFDDAYKQFIKKMQQECKTIIDYIFYHMKANPDIIDINIVNDNQIELRKYILEHQNEINFGNRTTLRERETNSYPNFFAIFVSLLVDIDECNNFNDIMEKIRKNQKPRHGTHSDYLKTSYCVCSHTCNTESLYEIDYIPLKRAFLVGCDCITKNKLVSPDIGKQMRSEIRNIRKKRKEMIENYKKMMESLINIIEKNSLKRALFNWKTQTINERSKLEKVINLSQKYMIKRMFSKWINKINKCIECKCLISKKEFFKNCENVKCDCKNEKLQKLYCWKCANNKFNRARFI